MGTPAHVAFSQLPSWVLGLDLTCPVSGAGPELEYHPEQVRLERGQGWGRQREDPVPWAGLAHGMAAQIAFAVQPQCKTREEEGGKRERKAPEGSLRTPFSMCLHPLPQSSILKKTKQNNYFVCVMYVCRHTHAMVCV